MGMRNAWWAVVLLGLGVSGCGPALMVRQGSRLFAEIGERNRSLAQQKEKKLVQLSPQLEASCRARAAEAPSLRKLAPVQSVVFDSTDEDMVVPRAVVGQLGVNRTRWVALKYERPTDADYLVYWERKVTSNEPLLMLEEHTLRVEDRAGRPVAADTQFALHWQGAMKPEFVRCAALLARGEKPMQTGSAPDFGALFDVFGKRG